MPQPRSNPLAALTTYDVRQKTVCHQGATAQVYHHKFTAESAAARIAQPEQQGKQYQVWRRRICSR